MSIRPCALSSAAFTELKQAYDHREDHAREHKARGGKVVLKLGCDVPDEILLAAGIFPLQICADPQSQTPGADRYLEYAFDPVVRAQFEKIVGGSYSGLVDGLAISNSTDVIIRVYLYLREMRRSEPGTPIPPLSFIDWLFTRHRLHQERDELIVRLFRQDCEKLCGHAVTDDEIMRAAALCNEDRAALRLMNRLRTGPEVRITGCEALVIIGSALFMDRARHAELVREVAEEAKNWPVLSGSRVFFTGSNQEDLALYEMIEETGAVIVGEDTDWGSRFFDRDVDLSLPADRAITDRYTLREFSGKKAFVSQRVSALQREVSAAGAGAVIFYTNIYEDAASWDEPSQKKALEAAGLKTCSFHSMPWPASANKDLPEKISAFISGSAGSAGSASEAAIGSAMSAHAPAVTSPAPAADAKAAPAPRPSAQTKPSGSKSSAVKKLQATASAGAYQKQWFKELKAEAEKGGDFAYLNADVPMEIFRAMDIPFVVNQWWAAICGAKRMTRKYFGLLREAGYRDDLCSYCATALAESMDPDDHALSDDGTPLGPWGGLPDPSIAITRLTCDCQSKIFELFAKNHGAQLYVMENTIPRKVPSRWFDVIADDWEDFYDTDRLDAAVDELKELIRFLEMKTGRMFDINRLAEVMELINEQESWYKKTRDLIAASHPVPVTVVDTINAVMQAQWQRGTRWAADHAKSLYEEIKALCDSGEAAVPNERLRLMWIGRGIWHDFSFYQRFEQKYGAVFMWSMYLAMGADAYIRNHVQKDPLRALAARYIGMEDFLHMPPWNSEWYVQQAGQNDIDGVVYMVPENCMQAVEGSAFIVKALEDAGYPVLTFHADPVDPRKWNAESMSGLVDSFIETRVIPAYEQKHCGE